MLIKVNFRKYLFVISLIFSWAVISGYATTLQFPLQSQQIVDAFFGSIGFTKEMSLFSIFIFIFLNNAIKAFLVVVLGFFFSLVPILFIYANGELIGLVSGVFIKEEGIGRVLLAILPHGVIEIIGMILAASYGTWLGVCFYRRLFKGEAFRENLYFAIRKYVKVILPLILIAAIIETFITPVILNMIFPSG